MTITAILSALPEEQLGLMELLHQPHKTAHAGRDFWQGGLHGQPVVLALSRVGKVAAATTATALIERFGVSRMVFTGVAGGMGPGVNVGDVVVAADFVQHDLDASPLFPRYEVPLYGQTRFACDTALTARLLAATRAALGACRAWDVESENWPQRGQFLPGLQAHSPAMGQKDGEKWTAAANLQPTFPKPDRLLKHMPSGTRIHLGLIASGDRFVSAAGESGALQAALNSAGHEVLAVEMEGAAVAQVCFDYGVPFAAVRTISDRADDQAHVDFQAFVAEVASHYARVIIERLLKSL